MRDKWVLLFGSSGVGAFEILLFIWHGGVVSGGVFGLDLEVGGIDNRGLVGSSRCGGFVLAAVVAALGLVYLSATEILSVD